MLSIASAVAAFFGFLRDLLRLRHREEDRKAGRDEVTAKTNAETLETKDAMDEITRPSDDAVADSLRTKQF